MNNSLNEINIQNMNMELVAQMFKNYQSNVLFHLEGMCFLASDLFSGRRFAYSGIILGFFSLIFFFYENFCFIIISCHVLALILRYSNG